jgi:hypothetical protein
MPLDIRTLCPKCNGVGIYYRTTGPVDPCPFCLGTKVVDIPEIIDDTELVEVVSDSLDKCPASLILENTDATEYLALAADKKAWFQLFISAGTLNMNTGSQARNLMLSIIFPPGTTSNTNITAALGSL